MKKRHVTCLVDGCGRRQYARGYCQTHFKQLHTTGVTVPIRPYQPRDPDRVKYAGLRLTKRCAAVLKRRARQRRLSAGAVIADILEQWHLRQRADRS